MEQIAVKGEKQVWFHDLPRPCHLDDPFAGEPYVCILFANDPSITPQERSDMSRRLVETGCRYAVCAGHECSAWDDAVDWACLEMDQNFSPPDKSLVMTSWHADDSVAEVVHFGLMCTNFDQHDFRRYLVLSIGTAPELRDAVRAGIRAVK